MAQKSSPIVYKGARPLGIGRLTSLANSTSERPGILLGSPKGLFHMDLPTSKARRIRKYPIGYIISGETGLVCYEEYHERGRLAFLDANLEETKTDTELARKLNPVAFRKGKIILLHQGNFMSLDPLSSEIGLVAPFEETMSITPFIPVGSGYEFIAVLRKPRWRTGLYKLSFYDESATVHLLAVAEDPIISRHILKLSGHLYLVIPQGKPLFMIYRLFEGAEPCIRTWQLVPIIGEAQPAGIIRQGKVLLAACSDNLLNFEIKEELLEEEKLGE